MVLDSSTIIVVVHELKRREIVERLREHGIAVAVPRAVREELERAGRNLGFHVEVLTPKNRPPLLAGLGEGEREAIQLALELTNKGYNVILVVDDEKARRKARKLGLRITGTLGLIELAKKTGIISKMEALNIVRDEIPETSLYITEEVLEQAMERIEKQKVHD